MTPEERENLAIVSLRDYVEGRCEWLAQYFESRIIAVEGATRVAADALNRRLEGMNELRDAMKDQSAQFVSRKEHDLLTEDIRGLRESRAKEEGKATQSQMMIAWAMAGGGLVLSIVALILRFLGA